MENIKRFENLQIGDRIYYLEDNELVGRVMWKGGFNDLLKSQYKHLGEDSLDNDFSDEIREESLKLNWIVTKSEKEGLVLHSYGTDEPHHVICYNLEIDNLKYWADYLGDEKPEEIGNNEELYELMFNTWNDWDEDADDENKMDDKLKANVCYTLTIYHFSGYPVNSNVIEAMIAQL